MGAFLRKQQFCRQTGGNQIEKMIKEARGSDMLENLFFKAGKAGMVPVWRLNVCRNGI